MDEAYDKELAHKNLETLRGIIQLAPQDDEAKTLLIAILHRTLDSENMPIGYLVRLGTTLADCRRDELSTYDN